MEGDKDMFWVVAFVILALICCCLGETMGKLSLTIVVVGGASLLFYALTEMDIFITVAMACAGILIVIIAIAIIKFIFSA